MYNIHSSFHLNEPPVYVRIQVNFTLVNIVRLDVDLDLDLDRDVYTYTAILLRDKG